MQLCGHVVARIGPARLHGVSHLLHPPVCQAVWAGTGMQLLSGGIIQA